MIVFLLKFKALNCEYMEYIVVKKEIILFIEIIKSFYIFREEM